MHRSLSRQCIVITAKAFVSFTPFSTPLQVLHQALRFSLRFLASTPASPTSLRLWWSSYAFLQVYASSCASSCASLRLRHLLQAYACGGVSTPFYESTSLPSAGFPSRTTCPRQKKTCPPGNVQVPCSYGASRFTQPQVDERVQSQRSFRPSRHTC